MGKALRQSVPFMGALLIGALAGALVAGVALLAAHSWFGRLDSQGVSRLRATSSPQ